jgi:catechol 2,3-dioxygenase-like lactoylglutathione lyase family enzyme
VITGLDHVLIGAEDVGAATAAYEALLGVAPHGARFRLANTALILMPADAEGLLGLAFAAANIAETAAGLQRRGLASKDGRIDPGASHGVRMDLIQAALEPPPDAGADAVEALDHVVIHTDNPDRAVALYGARLGLDFRLDRANPQWGSRLMFFRCGAAVVEISADLKAPISDEPDKITGLAWRVRNPRAARARIATAGFDVSEVREGRKPGTAVFTVRSGVVGAPALMIGPTPA